MSIIHSIFDEANNSMNTFFVRAVTGLIVATVFIAAILLSRISYGLVVMLVAAGGVFEFYTITAKARGASDDKNRRERRLAVILTIVAGLLSWLLNFRYVFADLAIVFPVILFVYFVRALFSTSERPFQDIAWGVLPLVYILLPLLLLNWLYFEKGELFALAVLFAVWFYDSFCYIVGSLLGRTKLIERISPKKTVEGLVGGMILTLTLVWFYPVLLTYIMNRWHLTCASYSPIQWLVIGFVTIIFATFGDLVESMLKRSLNIKDSGSIMPGHGGFLDRLDAVLVAIPFAVATIWLVDQVNTILSLIDYLKG